MNLARVLLAPLLLLGAVLLAPMTASPALAVPVGAEVGAPRIVDRGRFTVEVSGEGPDVILIPGLASSRAVWDGLTPSLAGYRVHRVQIAGFAGLAAGPNAEGAIVDPAVEELHRYIVDQGLDRAAVIGHSMGGLSGLLLAQRHPESVGRLLIVDALPFFSALFDPSATPASVEPYAGQMRSQMTAMAADAFAAGQERTAATLILTPAMRPAMVAWSVASDRQVMAQAMYDVMTTDARPGLAAMTTPVTVLYAWDASMGAPVERMDALYAGLYAGLAGARLVRVDGSYHFIMFDQPDRFADEVRTFLEAR